MSYFESAEGVTITKNRAFREFLKHNQTIEDWQEFTAQHGEHAHYDAQTVLTFLGY